MTHVTSRLIAKNRDQLWNPTLGNRVWATFTFTFSFNTAQALRLAGENVLCTSLALSKHLPAGEVVCDEPFYTVSQKKQDTKLLPITSPNIGRFSKFFHC